MDKFGAWSFDIQSLANSGALDEAIRSVFGVSHLQDKLDQAIASIAAGDLSALPNIVFVDQATMGGHLGAYASASNTIYVSEELRGHTGLITEVLTHELGHAIATQYFSGQETSGDAYAFTYSLIGHDHAMILTSPDGEHHTVEGSLSLPGSDAPVSVEWFDTQLHIDWMKAVLPMMNAKAFSIITNAQNDSDAFFDIAEYKLVAGFSPYGLQTDSATHFDNNNIRGGIETARKRWADGTEKFNSTDVKGLINAGAVDTAYVGRKFSGADAGVENLLYRFGQISHAMQDFYSHSNWVELSRVGNSKWLGKQTLLDDGLGLPTPLNPADYLADAPRVMVGMSGPNYDQLVKQAGVGSYSGSAKIVHFWSVIDQNLWGEVFATPKSGTEKAGADVGVLMSGAVSGAIYYDTDYSMPLRAVNRSGFFEKEYFRGFSHGGFAGTIYGQWVSPLSKDKEDNGRFSDKAANKSLYVEAQSYADLQVKNDWDRMGNLIFEKYGVPGLRKFANFAVVESARDLYIETYSKSGGRWNWDVSAFSLPPMVLAAAQLHAAEAHFEAELPLRQIEVFFSSEDANFATTTNRKFLTQFEKDGQWYDSAAVLVGTHIHDVEDVGPSLYQSAAKQHGELGGRALSSTPYTEGNNVLGTIFDVENGNLGARVFINNFDVDMDLIRIVDANGNVVKIFDLDEADFDEIQQTLLKDYNILVNARPDLELSSTEKVVTSKGVNGPIVLQASDFFQDPDLLNAVNTEGHSQLSIVSYDETLPWLKLENGQLIIADISKVPHGSYDFYVSVSDGAGVFSGQRIVLAIDPEIQVGGSAFAPTTGANITFRTSSDSAISIYGAITDGDGQLVAEIQHLALRIGDNAGLPEGVDPNRVITQLGDGIEHGTMQFFADFHNGSGLTPLVAEQGAGGLLGLKLNGQIIADLSVTGLSRPTPIIDEFYVDGVGETFLLVPFAPHVTVSNENVGRPFKVDFDVTISKETAYGGAFGFLLADMQTGYVLDPKSFALLENAALTVDAIDQFAVFLSSGNANGSKGGFQTSASFVIDGDLNLSNLALLPYFKATSPQGTDLFFSADGLAADGMSHIVRIGENTFACEDVVGGDYDFDDMIVTVGQLNIRELV